uniref:Uncharacterized protein n=1 Tax=Arcella intermedia TaxID=1963864 RepID=A0A6B2LK41_9EUKA
MIVLGEGGVGKSTYVIQYIQEIFIQEYDPTIEDSYRKQVNIDGTPLMLDILDTASNDEWGYNYREAYMRSCDGFIFIFSLTSRQTLDYLSGERDKCLRVRDVDEIPHVLVGNKMDLVGERQVGRDECQEMASNWGCPYYEISAKTREGVVDSMEGVVREVIRYLGVPKVKQYKRQKGGCNLL